MAVSFIQLGQCGNQIGANFYEQMFNQGIKSSNGHQGMLQQFFYLDTGNKPKAKAILIDMEPKVVNKNLQSKANWKYQQKLSLVQEEGSGNNWAYGCNAHGPRIRSKLQKLFQSFAQKQDYINCFIQIQSLAGGTGSGLGTYVLELLNEMFPKTPKFLNCIMPHLSGEVILQSYNTCLSIGTTYNQADGIFIIQNDQISQICLKNLKIQKTTLHDINQIIGRNLASIYFPIIHKNISKVYSIQENGINYGIDFIEHVFNDSKYKLGHIKTVPHGPKNSQSFNFDSWQAIENQLLYKKKTQSKGSLIVARGPDHPLNLISNNFCLFDKHPFYNYNRSASLIDNGPKFTNSLEQILTRGYRMFQENAYIYQYEKYGLEKEYFLECFGILQNIQQNYHQLS